MMQHQVFFNRIFKHTNRITVASTTGPSTDVHLKLPRAGVLFIQQTQLFETVKHTEKKQQV